MCDICGDETHAPALTRRNFLRAAPAAALVPWWSNVAMAADPPKPGAAPPQNAIAPADALKRILEGNARYVANTPNERDFSVARAARAGGQWPIGAILSCADSRVGPELIFDQAPGDLFVCRVAGNIVTNNLLASLEYGVQFLGAPLIFVMGHSSCGAVDAAIKVMKTGAKLPGRLPELVAAIKPAVAAVEKKPGDLLENATVENVRRQVARLKSSAPVIEKAYRDKKIDIAGGVYDIATGKVTLV